MPLPCPDGDCGGVTFLEWNQMVYSQHLYLLYCAALNLVPAEPEA